MAGKDDFDPSDADVLSTAGEASEGNTEALSWLVRVAVVLAALIGLVASTVYVVAANLGSSARDAVSEMTEGADGDEEDSDDSNDDSDDSGFWSV